ncbi:MAG: DUF4900 domain-containing protein [Balneola sp.]
MGKSLLFLVGGLTIITGYMQVQNNQRLQTLPEVTAAYFEEQQARNIAKSMIDNAIEHMKANNSWTDSLEITDVMNVGSVLNRDLLQTKNIVKLVKAGGERPSNQQQEIEADQLLAAMDQAGISGSLKSYTQSSTNIPVNNSVGTWDEYKVLLVSTSTYDGIEITTEVLMQRDSFSKYSYMTDDELSSAGSDIWFMGSDNIYGPIHTNGTFKMSGTPSFYGLITSPNNWVAHSTNGATPNFYGGENFNAPTKSSPSSYEISKLTTAAASGGLSFTNQLDIRFYESGGVGYADINEWNGTSWSGITTYNLSTTNGVISTTGRVDVEGVIKGQITLHSESLIEIDGDITYFTNPLVDSSSTDMLGIVSEDNVRIDENAHSASGSLDLDIHASIMAMNTSFYVENYASYSPRGSLNLLGGLIQRNRGPVGTFSGTTIVSGFSKNYQYDGRLKGSIPPHFPRESIFSIVYWKDEVVKVTN